MQLSFVVEVTFKDLFHLSLVLLWTLTLTEPKWSASAPHAQSLYSCKPSAFWFTLCVWQQQHSYFKALFFSIIYTVLDSRLIWRKMFHGLQLSNHPHTSVKLFSFQSSHCSLSSPFLTWGCIFLSFKQIQTGKHLCWILSTLKVGHRIYGKEHISFIEIKTLWYIENWWLPRVSFIIQAITFFLLLMNFYVLVILVSPVLIFLSAFSSTIKQCYR